MNVSYILGALILISIIQVAHAQSLTDSIQNAVNNNIENTFGSIGQASNNSNNSAPVNGNGSQSTTTTTTTTSGPGNSNSTTTTMKTNSQ
jgi:hypothetical protein